MLISACPNTSNCSTLTSLELLPFLPIAFGRRCTAHCIYRNRRILDTLRKGGRATTMWQQLVLVAVAVPNAVIGNIARCSVNARVITCSLDGAVKSYLDLGSSVNSNVRSHSSYSSFVWYVEPLTAQSAIPRSECAGVVDSPNSPFVDLAMDDEVVHT